MYLEKRFYKIYSPLTDDKLQYVIPGGKTLYVEEFGGDASYHSDTYIIISFDGQVLFSTFGSSEHKTSVELVGDDAKSIDIYCNNNSIDNKSLGGFWKGRLL